MSTPAPRMLPLSRKPTWSRNGLVGPFSGRIEPPVMASQVATQSVMTLPRKPRRLRRRPRNFGCAKGYSPCTRLYEVMTSSGADSATTMAQALRKTSCRTLSSICAFTHQRVFSTLLARKCFTVAITLPRLCTPLTTPAPILPLKTGSSPYDSWERPQCSQGRTLMVGSSAAWICSRSAIPPTALPTSSSSSASQVAARRLCAGNAGAAPDSGHGGPKFLHVMPFGPSRMRKPATPSLPLEASSKATSPASGEKDSKRRKLPLDASGCWAQLHRNHDAWDSGHRVSMHVCRSFSSRVIPERISPILASSTAA
mmetsp:Transcript_57493/g.168849  ORF Transcript_57493/g.168849 Transcript_57493/m.168849 type:complete len:312 (+) Transcript_57493:1707-2642(+)